MKKIVLIFTFFITSLLYSNELQTVYSYQNALYKAKQENKLVMVMMSYHGCPVCDYMKDIVFERPNVLDYLNKHFLVVIKDIEKDYYPQRFSAIDSPTFFFIDPMTLHDLIPKKTGGFRPEQFLSILHEATGEAEQNSAISPQDDNGTIAPCPHNAPCQEKKKVHL